MVLEIIKLIVGLGDIMLKIMINFCDYKFFGCLLSEIFCDLYIYFYFCVVFVFECGCYLYIWWCMENFYVDKICFLICWGFVGFLVIWWIVVVLW